MKTKKKLQQDDFFRSNYQPILLDIDPCPYCYNKIEETKSCLLQRERGCSGGLGDCGGGLEQDGEGGLAEGGCGGY